MSTTDASETDAILAQFPGPVSIYPDGDKVVGLLAIAALFVILGVFGAFHARQHIWFLDYVMSALCIFYFGWLLVGFTRLVTSGAPLLTLRGDGLSATTGLRKWDLKWGEVREVFVGYVGFTKFVYLRYRLASGSRRLFAPYLRLAKVQPMKVDDLSRLLNLWRERAIMNTPRSDTATWRLGGSS